MENIFKELKNVSAAERLHYYLQLSSDSTFSKTFLKRNLLGLDDEQIVTNDEELIRDSVVEYTTNNLISNGISDELAEKPFNRYALIPLEE